MPSVTLLTAALVGFISAAVHIYVGIVVSGRQVKDDSRLAAQLFAVWWYALAASTLLTASLTAGAAFGFAPLLLHEAVGYLQLIVISLALACLLYYLIFIYTGSSRVLKPLFAAYFVYAVALVAYIAWADPTAVVMRRWQVQIQYARPLEGVPLLILVLTLIGPQFVAAIAYFTLVFRVHGRSRKYRIVLVSTSIFVWFGTALVSSLAGVQDRDAWQLASRLIALAAALTILIAFRPPALIRRRLEVRSVGPQRAP